jgi:predicted heme/steroid binding protein
MKRIFTPYFFTAFRGVCATVIMLTSIGLLSAHKLPDPNPIRSEVRDAYTEIVTFSDGSQKLKSFIEPAFYQDLEGNWRTISTKIVSSDFKGDSYKWENITGIYQSWYPKSPGISGVKTVFNSIEIEEWIEPGHAFLVDGKWKNSTAYSNRGIASVNGSQLLYKEVAPGITVEFLQQNSRRKMNVLLSDEAAIGNIPANASHFVSYETWRLPEGMSLKVNGTQINILDAKGRPLAAVESPEIYELNNRNTQITGTWSVTQNGNLWTIGLLCPMEWLQASTRSFPVVIDPTINFTAFNVSLGTGFLTTAAGTPTTGTLRMASTTGFTFAKFDISSLPYDANISSVVFYGYHYSGSMATNKVVRINDLGDVDPTTATGTEISNQINLNNSYNAAYVFGATSASYGWKAGTLSGSIISDIQLRSVTKGWLGLGMNYVSGATGIALHYAYDGLFPPYLEVTYTNRGHVNDARVVEVTPISNSKVCAGSNPVYALIRNEGSANLTSLTLNWSVNSSPQTPLNWTGNLSSGDTARVLVGNFNFPGGSAFSIQVASANPNSVTDPNTSNDTINRTGISSFLNGNYTIGAGGDYTTFNSALTALSIYGVCGNVNFNVASGTYNEQLSIPQVVGAGISSRITFQSTGLDSTLVTLSNTNTPLVTLAGADYFTFRKMTLQTLNTGTTARTVEINGGGTDNIFENCRLIGSSSTNTSTTRAVVYSISNTLQDNNNIIRNNVISGGAYGIYWDGVTANPYEAGLVIEGNSFSGSQVRPALLQALNAPIFRNNIIDHTTTTATAVYAASFTNCYNSTQITGNHVSTKQHGFFLSNVEGTSGARAKVYNNIIISVPPSSLLTYGIHLNISDYVNVYHNSLNLVNSFVPAVVSYNIYDVTGTNNTYRNNIFRQSGGNGTTDYLVFTTGLGTGTTFDYNNYAWNTGSTNIASINGTVYSVSNSISWLSGGVGGANSIARNPEYISNTNLNITQVLLNAGQNLLSEVATDHSGLARTNPPTIGALEYRPGSNEASPFSIAPVLPCPGANNIQVVVRNYGEAPITSLTFNWTVNGVPQPAFNWSGSIALGVNSTPITIGTYSFSAASSYTIQVVTSSPNGNVDSKISNDTVSSSVVTALGGTYTIGSGGDYGSFAAARTDLITYGVCGNVTFNILNGTYTESLVLPHITGAGSNATITFQSQALDSTAVTLQSNTNPVINMNGADYYRFRKMTLATTSTSTTAARVIDFNTTSTNNTIEYCQVNGNSNTGTVAGRSAITSVSAATNDANNVIRNNRIRGGSHGIFWDGFTTAPHEAGLVIENNNIDGAQVRPILVQNVNAVIIKGNTINHTATTAVGVYALSLTTALDNSEIANNRIVSKQHGIFISGVSGTSLLKARIYNNYVASIPIGTVTPCYGLHFNNSTHINTDHNSVNIENPYSGSTSSVVFDQNGTNLTFRNNVFRLNGADDAADYIINQTAAGAGNVYDYNNYVWNPGAPNIATINSSVITVSNSLSFLSGGVGGANSIHFEPGFLTSTNLRHNSSQLNVGLDLTASIPSDINGTTRVLPVTIGAYEFKPGADDAGVVSIAPQNPCLGVNNVEVSLRNFGSQNLTDVTINWRINGVDQIPYVWSGTLAPSVNSPVTIGTYDFLLNNTYSIRAWTSSPNLSVDSNNSNDSLQINVATALSGNYVIGSGGDFANFNQARNALITYGICGNTTFNVVSGTYTEFFSLPSISGTAPNRTITFQSQSGDSTAVILQSSNNPVVNFSGADYVRFNKMTIQTTSTSTAAAKVIDVNSTSTHNTLEHCQINGNTNTGTGTGRATIFSTSSATNDAGNVIRNNRIRGGSYSIYWDGFITLPYEDGLVISSNNIEGAQVRPIYMQYLTNVICSNNTINHTTTTSTGVYAISLTNGFEGGQISGNLIHTKQHGILLATVNGNSGARVNVFNNAISSTPASSLVTYGLHLNPASFINVWHNSTNMINPFTTNYSVYDQSGSNNSYRNNIFRNLGIGTTADVVVFSTGAASGTTYDYNSIVWTPTAVNIASINGTVYSVSNSINYFVNGVGGLNSINANPGFVSNTNLNHTSVLVNNGLDLTSVVATDIKGETRTLPPTMGAFEYKPGQNDAGVVAILPQLPCPGNNSVQVSLRNYGVLNLTSANVNWTVNGVPQAPFSWSGTISPSLNSAPITIGTYNFVSSTSYSIVAWTTSPNGVTDQDIHNDTLAVTATTALGGTYTIGSGGDYVNFTAARNDLVSFGICGSVTFNVANGTYTEAVSLPPINGASSISTITFQSASNDSSLVILQSATSPVLNLAGADHIKVRTITIQTTSASTSAARVIDFNTTATNNTIEHCALVGNSNTGAGTGRSVIACISASTLDLNNKILNNTIQGGSYGIYWDGFSIAPFETGIVISGNNFSGAYVRGVFVQSTSALILTNNTIDHTSTANTAVYAASLTSCFNDYEVSGNRIVSKQHGLFLNSADGTSLLRGKVFNNFISCIVPSALVSYGIHMANSDFVNLQHNSINVINPFTTCYGFYNQAGTNDTVRNNIIRVIGSGIATDFNLFTTGTGVNNSYNYNSYVWGSLAPNIASINGTIYTTSNPFPFFTNGVGGMFSVSIEPGFNSDTDLMHSTIALNSGINLTASIPTDINGVTRVNPVSIGATEYKPGPNDAGIASILPAIPCSGVNNVQVVIRNYGTDPLTSATISWSVNSVPQTPFNWTGTIAPGSNSNPVTIGTFNFVVATSYGITSATSSPNGFSDSNNANNSNSSNVITALGGTYTIGSGGDYANPALAAADLVSYGICGPVTFNIMNGTYVGNLSLPQISGTGPGVTITFQSQSGDSSLVILQSNVSPVIDIAGGDYIRLSKVTIQTTNTLTTAGMVISLNTTASNNTIENCRLIGNVNTGTATARSVIGSISTLTFDSYNTIRNNRITGGSHAIYIDGFNAAPYEPGLVIEGNICSGSHSRSMYLQFLDAPVVRQNSFDHTTSAVATSYAVSMFNCYNDLQVTRNLIQGKQHGLQLSTVVGTALHKANISNNWISCSPTISLTTYGLHSASGQHLNIHHNSINVVNAFTTSYGLYSQSNTNSSFQNNIIRSVGSTVATNFTLFTSGSNATNVFDYNDYVWQSGAPNVANIGGTVYSVSNSINFLTGGLGGSHSVNVNPSFVSVNNLNSCAFGLNVGLNLTGVSLDYNGLTRRSVNRSIGAVEVPEMPAVPSGLTAPVIRCNELDIAWNIGNSTTGYQVQVSTNSAFTNLVSGYNPASIGLTNTLNVFGLTANTTYYIRLRGTNTCGTGNYSSYIVVNTAQVADSVLLSSNTPVCAGNTLSFSANSSLPGIQYVWMGPDGYTASGASVSRTSVGAPQSGVYTVMASATGCSAAALTTTVAVNNPISVLSVGGNNTLCSGESLILTADAIESGVQYAWVGPNAFTAATPTASIFSIQTIGGGIYSVTATSPGCNQLTDVITVTVIPTITVNLSSNSPVCESNQLYITLTPRPAAVFYWQGPNGFSSNDQNPSVSSVTLNSAGLYTLFVNQPGCNTLSYNIPVVVGARLTNLSVTSNSAVCSGNTLNLSATSYIGSTYLWSGPLAYTATGVSPVRTSVTPSMAGNYTLNVTSPGCPSATRSLNVLVTNFTGLSSGSNSPVCQGSALYLSGIHYSGATYSWSGPNGYSSSVLFAGLSSAQPSESGVYTLSASIPGCGTLSETVSVAVGSPLVNTNIMSNSPVCEGGNLGLSATDLPGVSYSWTGPASFTSLAPEPVLSGVDQTAGGIYTVAIVSPGCGSTTRMVQVRIGAPLAPVAGAVTNPFCEGAQLLLTCNTIPFATYSWSGPSGFVSSVQNPGISNATTTNAGEYTVIVSEPACGTESSTVTIQVGVSLNGLNPGSNSPVCNSGTINLSAVSRSGLSYFWSGPNGFTSSSVNPSILGATAGNAGIYSLEVSTPGCGTLHYQTTVFVVQPSGYSASSNSPLCSNTALNLISNGSSFSSYSWSGPNGFVSTLRNPSINSAQSLNGGVYTVSITDPGCGITTLTTTVTVGASLLNVAATSNAPLCVGGTLNLSSSTIVGADYFWEGPNGFNSILQNPVIAGVTAFESGSYSVTISTPGCNPESRNTLVTINPSLVASPSSNSPLCQGSVLYLSANIPSGVTYLWSGPNGFTSSAANPSIINATPTSSGLFTLTLTRSGCGSVSGTTSVLVGGSISGTTLSTNSPVCAGATLNVSSSTISSATYLWSGPAGFTANTQNVSRTTVLTSAGGVYTLVVSSPGCGTTTRTITTAVNPAIVVNAGSNSPLCQGNSISLSVNSITGSTYSWTGPAAFASANQNPTISNATTLRTGIYSLTINSPTCGIVTTTTSVTVGSSIGSLTVSSNSPVCQGNNLTLTATNRTGFFFSWVGPNGFTSSLAQPVIAGASSANSGRYTVTITSLGCGTAVVQSSSLVVNNPGIVAASSNSPICIGSPIYFNGTAPSGSTYAWSGPAAFATAVQNPSRNNASLLHAGVYTLNATVPGCGVVSTTTTVSVVSCRNSLTIDEVISTTDGQTIEEGQASGQVKSIPTTGFTQAEMTVWPNPNDGEILSFRLVGLEGTDKSITLRVLDALGRQVWVESIKYNLSGSAEGQLNFNSRLAKGLYTIEAVHNGMTFYSKVVVE